MANSMELPRKRLLTVLFALLCCFTTLVSSNNDTSKKPVKALFTAVFWEVKPYVYRNEKGEIDGFYPEIFKNAEKMCGNASLYPLFNATQFISYTTFGQSSRRNFLEIFKNDEYPKGLVPGHDVYFPPIYSRTEKMQEVESRKHLRNFDVNKADNLAIIARRDHISLPTKIARGIKSCGQIFFISFLLTIFFGLLMWMFERINNPAFPDSCIMGTGTGVWWSFVSMTTVGYGDVVPNTIIGRCIAVVWVCIGVMIACIVTATVAEVVNGDDFDIAGERIAVIENSLESERLSTDFRAIPYEVATYEEVYEAVRRGHVLGGAVNAEIVAWDIDAIQDDEADDPLRVVKLLPVRLDLNIVFSRNIPPELVLILRCMYKFKDEVYIRAKTKFGRYCPTQTLYIETILGMFKSAFVRVLIGLILALCVVGAALDFHHRRKLMKKNGVSDPEADSMMVDTSSGNGVYTKDQMADAYPL